MKDLEQILEKMSDIIAGLITAAVSHDDIIEKMDLPDFEGAKKTLGNSSKNALKMAYTTMEELDKLTGFESMFAKDPIS